MSDDSMKTVNIRVPSNVWDGIDENKSEICRQALRARAEETARGDVRKYTQEYENAVEDLREQETEVEVKRQMLYDELETWNYGKYILPDEHPEDAGTFEETIMFASKYAQTYLSNDQERQLVIHQIRQDMAEEGRNLPKGVAEWVVDQVDDQL